MDEQEANAKLVLGTIYILLGMGLISMCINLMQEKIVSQVEIIMFFKAIIIIVINITIITITVIVRQTRGWCWVLSTSCWAWVSYPCASTLCRRRLSHRCRSSYSL